ncbi:MAG TPA: ADOP family duplicated permease [Vicinamibacterales bacterium]|nr:ADOP family duplicated permease [Vicinamibacterales bacterium]
MREELEAHVAMRAEHDRMDEAAARRRLGNLLHTRESMRRVWIAEWWDALRQDAWFTWRSWRRHPGFALGAIFVLALGLGASIALFAALDRALFRPLPYADPDRLVSVGLLDATPGSFLAQTEAMVDKGYVQVWDTTPAPFDAVTAMNTATCAISEERPEHVRCGTVESNFLRVLGVQVAAGRGFTIEDDVRGAPRVALISYGLWVRRYGADPRAIGRTLTLESEIRPAQRVPIVGILPADFEMPMEAADILLPLQLRPLELDLQYSSFITAVARLRPEVTPGRAELMLAPQLPAILKFLPATPKATWRVQRLRDRRIGDGARLAWLLVGVVAVFQLIACVNVTSLLLARVAERQQEFAVRAAVGAGKTRLVRLALVESLLLSLSAGALAVLAAFALLKTFVTMAPPGIPGIAEASIDARAFGVAIPLAVLTGLAIGPWPAISLFRVGGLQRLRSNSLSSSGVRPRVRFALVTTQIALTVALLGGSALLLRSLWNMVNVPLGFDGERVITLTASLSATGYPTAEHGAVFFEQLLARARATPGALSAALSDAAAPRGRRRGSTSIGVDGRSDGPGARHPTIRIREVTPGYFETFRIPLVSGRTFQEADWGGEPLAVLTESAELILFAGERAVGRRVQAPATPDGPWRIVVGVTADIRNGQRVTDAPEPEIYLLAKQGAWGRPAVAGLPPSRIGRLVLRTTASPAAAEAMLRQIAADLDSRLPVTIESVDQQVASLTEGPRFVAWLLSAFAALALLLAAAGLYSVAAYLVAQRRRDTAVRVALGAAPREVAGQVIGEAGRWIIGGAVVGSALGWMSTRALQSQLYHVEALDPWSWATALLVLSVVLAIAVLRPAYRAAHVDPVAALKAD